MKLYVKVMNFVKKYLENLRFDDKALFISRLKSV